MPGLEGTILGPYHLQRRLGYGGMAEVYLAYDRERDCEVAVKVMRGTNADYLERFRREAEAISKLAHDHILPVFDYNEREQLHYLVMLYTPAGTLRDLLINGPLGAEEASQMLDQIAEALQFAHDRGVLHRDIKPSNILLRDDHYAYLADFGLAKVLEDSSELTQAGVLLGTPEYMAPDLADGPATVSTDIYALAILLYEMITGCVPFMADTAVAVFWKHIREYPLPPSQHNPQLSCTIDKVILCGLDKDPRRRFRTARELADAYRKAVYAAEECEAEEAQSSNNGIQASVAKFIGRLEPLVYTSPAIAARRIRLAGPWRKKVVLPGNFLAIPTMRPMHIPAVGGISLPSLPVQPPKKIRGPVTSLPRYQRQKAHQIYGKSCRQTTLAVSIIAFGLLLFIVLPMSYFYYLSRSAANVPGAAIHAAMNGNDQVTRQAATASAVNKAINGVPVLIDSLAHNTHGRWTENQTDCFFSNGSYHVNVQQSNFLRPCPLLGQQVGDATVEVDVALLSGNSAGLVLRLNGEQFYDFEINNQGQFFFRRHDIGAEANYIYLIKATISNAILPVGQKNTLLVIAHGPGFKIYINDNFVGEVQDHLYSSGQLALAAGTLAPTVLGEGSFSNFKLFKIV